MRLYLSCVHFAVKPSFLVALFYQLRNGTLLGEPTGIRAANSDGASGTECLPVAKHRRAMFGFRIFQDPFRFISNYAL